MRTLYWDIETRSAVSLRECGANVYAMDPTTQVLCVVYATNDEDPLLWLPADPVPPVFLEIAADPNNWQLVAHNYDFERAILEHILIPRHDFRPIPFLHLPQRRLGAWTIGRIDEHRNTNGLGHQLMQES